MTLWQRIKSWFGFKPKAVPSKFGSSYEFHDNMGFSSGTQGIRNASTKDQPATEKNGVFIKDGVMSAGSQRDTYAEVQPVRRSTPTRAQVAAPRPIPIRNCGESEFNHRSSRSDGFVDGMMTGYVVGELIDEIGDLISDAPVTEPTPVAEPTTSWMETRSAPEPAYEPPASNWNDSGTTSWGGSNTTTVDGGSNWGSDISDAVSSVFSD